MAQLLRSPPSVAQLVQLGPEVHVLPRGALLWRVYFRGGAHPTTWSAFRRFGPTGARFDHQDPPRHLDPTKGIFYGADCGPTCIAEVFQDPPVIDRQHRQPALAAFYLAQDLELLDVTGAWSTRARASMAISSGSRKRAREWSRAIYQAYPHLSGIRYASSMNANLPAFALYERAAPAIPPSPAIDLPLSHVGLAGMLARAAADFGYRLA